jgi:hypothetical protein
MLHQSPALSGGGGLTERLTQVVPAAEQPLFWVQSARSVHLVSEADMSLREVTRTFLTRSEGLVAAYLRNISICLEECDEIRRHLQEGSTWYDLGICRLGLQQLQRR